MDNGVRFNKGSLFYETEILGEEIDPKKTEKIKSQGFEEARVKNGRLNIIMMNAYPEPKEFGDFQISGEALLYIKKNEKSTRVYLNALSDGMISNKVLGEFPFLKGKMYELLFTTIGRNPILSRNNIWIARRNLGNCVKDSVEDRIKHLAENI